ncbi:MAG: hypothetical protein AB4372_27335 [Xenococcus sp. (in: cyanobacteria)]
MKKLSEYYQNRKDELLPELMIKKSIQQVIEVFQDEIKRLSNIDSDYIGELTVPQARVASRKLGELYSTFNLLSTVGQQDLIPQQYTQDTASLVFKDNVEIRTKLVLISVGTGAILGRLLVPWLMFVLIVLIFVYYFLGLKKKPRKSPKPHVYEEFHSINLKTVDAILDYLQERFEDIDKQVANVESKPKDTTPSEPKLEDHPNLLEFLQKLMGEAHQEEAQLPKLTGQRINDLEMFLQWHGIETEFYHPSEGDNAWSKFDFEPSLDPNLKEAITIQPAFIKDDCVLLRGLVFQPS